ncbi:MAG: hypothetical protein GC155_06255 [Alphaproteobacteria bacterium]|nr:hypothetical protein [Alphaproteobacteria bacterium]
MVAIAALGLAAVSAVASLVSGAKQSQALKEQSLQAEYNARNLELQGQQVSAQRRAELNQSLSTIDAIRAGRNVASGSPTELAVKSDFRQRSRDAENQDVLAYRVGAFGTRYKGDQARRAAPFAIVGGIGQAAGSLAGGLAGFGHAGAGAGGSG